MPDADPPSLDGAASLALGRDSAYNNAAAVADSALLTAEWTVRSARVRSTRGTRLDWRYAVPERCRLDLFATGSSDAPILVFFHGGYWQSRAKEDFSFVAEGPLAAGMDVVLAGYTLAPRATLREIVSQCRAALSFLREQLAAGRARRPLVLAGWSAGAHLAASLLDEPGVAGALLVSGIYHLAPLRGTYLNAALQLGAADAAALSPALHLPAAKRPATVAWGTAELPALQWQSRRYAERLQARDDPVRILPIEGAHHFSVLEQLASTDGALTRALARLHNGPAGA